LHEPAGQASGSWRERVGVQWRCFGAFAIGCANGSPGSALRKIT